VITNDQGKYLVDTAFFRLADLPAVEVSGGCFCCNYDDLNTRLTQLIRASRPGTIFAESVGSCADIVATVVKPLLQLSQAGAAPSSFSVFADGRLLRRRLLNQDLPFSDDIVYIFDKQLEEAGLIVVNKIDLLSGQAVEEVQQLLERRFPGKPYLMQSSLSIAGVTPWLNVIQSGSLALPDKSLNIDYNRYGAGEAQLAWLDEQISLKFPPGQGKRILQEIISDLLQALSERRAGIGHLKFILQAGGIPGGGAKLSFTALPEPGWEGQLPEFTGDHAQLLVNARVEMEAGSLKSLLDRALDKPGLHSAVHAAAAFHPPQPAPARRLP